MKNGWFYRIEEIRPCVDFLRSQGIPPQEIRHVGTSGSGNFKYVNQSGRCEVLPMPKLLAKQLAGAPRSNSHGKKPIFDILGIASTEACVKRCRTELERIMGQYFPDGTASMVWLNGIECSVCWQGASMKVSFLSVPVPIDKTDPSFEDSAKQFLEAEMPNVVKALKKGAVTAAQKTKRQEFVQSVLSNARGEMLSRLPDGSSVHEQVLSQKAINVQFVVTIETSYGKIKHKKDICLAKRVEIEWDTKIDENGAPTIHIKNRKEAHAKMQTAILEMVLSGEERLEVPLDEFSQTIQGRCRWFDEKAQPLPTWFAKKPSISKVIYAFDFSTQQAHFSTPYFTFFKDDGSCEGRIDKNSYSDLASALMKDGAMQARLLYAKRRLKEEGIQIYREAGGGAGVGDSKFRATISGVSCQGHSFTYAGDLTEWEHNFDAMLSSLKEDAQHKKEELRDSFRGFYGNALAIAILKLVFYNSYITESAVAENLRGVKVALKVPITDINLSGRFNLIPADMVKDQCTALVNAGFLKTKYHHGTYGDFYTLHITPLGQKLLSLQKEDAFRDSFPDDSHFDEQLEPARYDNKFAWYLSLSSDDVPMTAKCMWYDRIEEIFSSAPPEIIKVLQMQKEIEEDPLQKKFLTKLIRAGKAKKTSEEAASDAHGEGGGAV